MADQILRACEQFARNTQPQTLRYLRDTLAIIGSAQRPLTIPELSDAIKVLKERHVAEYSGALLPNTTELLSICADLVEQGTQPTTDRPIVRLSSNEAYQWAIQQAQQPSPESGIEPTEAYGHCLITDICLDVLLLAEGATNTKNFRKKHLFAVYAARYWPDHLRRCSPDYDQSGVLQLFRDKPDSLIMWRNIYDHDCVDGKSSRQGNPDPVYYATLLGLESIVAELLDNAHRTTFPATNTTSGIHGSALQAAAYQGYDRIVDMLLDIGIDPNLAGGQYGTAIQAASYNGRVEIVRRLIRANASINFDSGFFGTALQAAAFEGHQAIVQLLLDSHADINQQAGEYGTALQAASTQGNIELVILLLHRGAGVNVKVSGKFGTALQAAAYYGHKTILEICLLKGAEVNTEGGYCGTALQAAAYHGNKEVVLALPHRGADPAIRGGNYGTAKQAATAQGHFQIVELLERWPQNN